MVQDLSSSCSKNKQTYSSNDDGYSGDDEANIFDDGNSDSDDSLVLNVSQFVGGNQASAWPLMAALQQPQFKSSYLDLEKGSLITSGCPNIV